MKPLTIEQLRNLEICVSIMSNKKRVKYKLLSKMRGYDLTGTEIDLPDCVRIEIRGCIFRKLQEIKKQYEEL